MFVNWKQYVRCLAILMMLKYTDDRWFCNSATYSNAVKFWIIFQVVMCALVFGFDTSDEHVGIYLDYHFI